MRACQYFICKFQKVEFSESFSWWRRGRRVVIGQLSKLGALTSAGVILPIVSFYLLSSRRRLTVRVRRENLMQDSGVQESMSSLQTDVVMIKSDVISLLGAVSSSEVVKSVPQYSTTTVHSPASTPKGSRRLPRKLSPMVRVDLDSYDPDFKEGKLSTPLEGDCLFCTHSPGLQRIVSS